MNVGDLVRWRMGEHVSPVGVVIEKKPFGWKPGYAILAWFDLLYEPEWFHEIELEIVDEGR